jgi:serine/threonine-protein kinase
MGAVLKGRDPDLNRDVALKVLCDDYRDDADMVRRFVEEAQIGGQLQHPGIVPIYELGTLADLRPFFAMKLVKGHTLAQLLEARKGPDDDRPRFLSIFEAVCQTMAYAHARGVIHRDLKPSNVMVGSFGEVQVMDWGLAKVLPRGGVADDEKAGQAERQETVIATARSGSDGPGLSRPGSAMGTPAYMAPEQARGEGDRVDERADVFALGSILCEVLTGQPAFLGRSSGEILRKAALGDPADALARLDACGAAAELVVIARDCLAREAEDRPRHAAEVADRVTAYLGGVQERLRIAERERAVAEMRAIEERRRRRLQLGLAASLLALITAGGLGATSYLQQRQARAAAVDRALGRAFTLRDLAREHADDPARWQVALAALDQAEGALADDAHAQVLIAALRAEVTAGAEAAERDRRLLDRLADIRSAKADDRDGFRTEDDYAGAFRGAGLDLAGGPAAVAAQIKARPPAVAMALASALDDWASVRRALRNDPAGAARLAEVARAADPDPWRNDLRDAFGLADPGRRKEALKALAGRAKFDELGPVSLDLLGQALTDSGDPALAESVLRRAQVRHPGDVWINLDLGSVLVRKLNRRDEAIRFYTAARALRPETAENLASALNNQGRSDEAIEIARDLVRLRPRDGRNRWSLADFLQNCGRAQEASAALAEAVAALREDLRLRPDSPNVHCDLGATLFLQGKLDEAVAEYRAAIRLRPDIAEFHHSLGSTLVAQGKLDEGVATLREAIRIEPGVGGFHNDLGIALRRQGKLDEAVAEYREAARLKPNVAIIRTNLGLGLMDQGRLDEAVAELREAIRIKPDFYASHNNLGIVLARQGQVAGAIDEYRAAIQTNPASLPPRLGLARLLQVRGDYSGAVEALRRAKELGSSQPGSSIPSARLLAEAEKLAAMADRLPKILKGGEKPRDAAEGLAAGQLCYDRRLHATAARLYRDAMALDPKLAEDLTAGNRYNAACCAALAGAGKGEDAPPLGEPERARWRKQAVEWLKADLSRRAEQDRAGTPEVRQNLLHWKRDTDLIGIRDAAAIAALPADEQAACRALWAEVDALLAQSRGGRP